MARSIVSPGMLWARAARTAVRSRGLAFASPPPRRAATVISLMSLVKIFPRLASLAAFLCLMVLHLEWPDIGRLRRDEGTRATDAADEWRSTTWAGESQPDARARSSRAAGPDRGSHRKVTCQTAVMAL